MAVSKKLKEEAKALGIPRYWNYGSQKLKDLILAKQPKNPPIPKNAVKAPAKPKAAAKPVSKPAVKKKDNKAEILAHITKCNALIAEERKTLKGPKAVHHGFMLDRALTDLKNVTMYLAKIK